MTKQDFKNRNFSVKYGSTTLSGKFSESEFLNCIKGCFYTDIFDNDFYLNFCSNKPLYKQTFESFIDTYLFNIDNTLNNFFKYEPIKNILFLNPIHFEELRKLFNSQLNQTTKEEQKEMFKYYNEIF